jgi:hypothetical protein
MAATTYRYLVTFSHTTRTGPQIGHFEYMREVPIRDRDDVERIARMIRGWGRTNVTVIAFSRFEQEAAS